MTFIPREYQRLIRNAVVEIPSINVFAGMGVGKTGALLDAVCVLRLLDRAQHVLVLAPKRVAETTWPDEVAKWSFPLDVAVCIGNEKTRIAALRQKAAITTINYDNVEWLIDVLGDDWFFDMVIADESTRVKGLRISLQTSKKGNEFVTGQGSKRAKALIKARMKYVKRWVNLTGSPAPNGLQDLWGQQFFIDGGRRLMKSFGAFKDRWFRTIQLEYGTKIEPLKYAKDEITRLMVDCSIVIDPRDWFDLKLPQEHIVRVTLPPRARLAYDEMESQYYTEVLEGKVEALNGGAKGNKCRQIAGGHLFDNDGNVIHMHDAKIDALKSIVTEATGASILVAYQFEPERDAILKAFPQARLLKGKQEIKAFQDGELQIGVCHPKSAGHGLSLQNNCWIMVDFSTGWNLEEDEQILERIGPMRQMQSGFDRIVYRYRIIAERTIEEEVVLPRITTKQSVQEAVRSALKKRLT